MTEKLISSDEGGFTTEDKEGIFMPFHCPCRTCHEVRQEAVVKKLQSALREIMESYFPWQKCHKISKAALNE